MKIAALETFPLRGRGAQGAYGAPYGLVVKLVTEDGIVGYGETDSMPSVVEAVILAPVLDGMLSGLEAVIVGHDAEPRAAWDRMAGATQGYAREGVVRHAMAAIDIALWDIAGKAAGRPVADLLGGMRSERLRAYASHPLGRTPSESADFAAGLVERGFTAVKFGWRPLGEDPARDEAIVAALRDAIGPDAELLIDGGMAWDLEGAAAAAARLAPYRPHWLEEPLPAYGFGDYAALRERAPMPIAAGEMASGAAELRRLVHRGSVDVLQVDVSRIGLTEAMRVAALAAVHDVPCVNHTYSYLLNAAASAHFAAAIENTGLFETQATPNEIRQDLDAGQLRPTDGWVTVPTGPGLGVEVDETVLRYYRSAA
jgi:L-rhamnonate dehydratase